MRRRRLAALVTAVSVALAGCGTTSLSAAQLRTRATRICAAAELRTDRIATPARLNQSARFLRLGVAALAPEVTALGQLRPPRDLVGRYRQALAAGDGELRALRFSLRGLKAGDDPVVAIKTLQQQLAVLEAPGNRSWSFLGVPACASR